MKTVFAQHHHVASNAPFDAVQSVIQELTGSARNRLEEMGRQFNEIRSIEEAHRYQLRKLLGDEGYDELRSLSRRRSERPRPPGKQPESHSEILARRAERLARVRALLSELKVSPEKLRAVNRDSRTKVAGTIPPPPSRDGHLVTLHRPYDIPSEIRDGKANPWTVMRPPFADWSWYYTGWHNAFGFAPTLFLNSDNGNVGNDNFLFDTDASDFDHAQIEYNASIGFWYQMPANGRLDIWIEADSQEALHQLSLVDEWGVSDAFSWQENYLAVKVDGLANDPWQKALTSWYKYDGDNEGHWANTYIPHGTISWAHLVTQNWFPKDSWVHVTAGTTSWHRATTNDMQIWSNLRFNWFIRSVWVEPIG